MTFHKAVSWLSSFEVYGVKLGLQNIQLLLKLIHWDQGNARVIHVSGTNGKGSVAAMLSSVLTWAGNQVGFFHSPHLTCVRERFLINHQLISKSLFCEAVSRLKMSYEAYLKGNPQFSPTYFEMTTALALWIFQKKKVDWILLETGMGGTWDSTNVTHSEIQIVTNVSKDHMQFLGRSLKKIAAEKAGIIRPQSICITGAKGIALKVIQQKALSLRTKLYREGHDFKLINRKGQVLDVIVQNRIYKNIKINLLGSYQKENTALALCAFHLLKKRGLSLPMKTLRQGLRRVIWPGRFHRISSCPPIWVDGAHNEAGMKQLCSNLKRIQNKNKIHLVMGCYDDKNRTHMIKAIQPAINWVTLVPIQSKRKQNVKILENIWNQYLPAKNICIEQNISKALDKMTQKNKLYIICGSLHLIGEVFKAYQISPYQKTS